MGANVLYLGVLEASCDFEMLELGDFAVVGEAIQAHEVINLAHRPISLGRRARREPEQLLAGSTMAPGSRSTSRSCSGGRMRGLGMWGGLPPPCPGRRGESDT